MDAIIIPCTKEKIWDANPELDAVAAKDAYTKPVFHDWRECAEKSGCPWFILSTKYCLILPDCQIEQYNVPISKVEKNKEFIGLLKRQANELNLQQYEQIFVLGWDRFEALLKKAIPSLKVELKEL